MRLGLSMRAVWLYHVFSLSQRNVETLLAERDQDGVVLEIGIGISPGLSNDVEHRQSRYLNNRAENSHRPMRRHERQMLISHDHPRPILQALQQSSEEAHGIGPPDSWRNRNLCRAIPAELLAGNFGDRNVPGRIRLAFEGGDHLMVQIGRQ